MSLSEKQILEIRKEIERRRGLLLVRLAKLDEKKAKKGIKVFKEKVVKDKKMSKSNTEKILKAAKTLRLSEEELRKLGLIDD